MFRMNLKTCADKTGDIVTVLCLLLLITIISSFTVVLFVKCVCVCVKRGGGPIHSFQLHFSYWIFTKEFPDFYQAISFNFHFRHLDGQKLNQYVH